MYIYDSTGRPAKTFDTYALRKLLAPEVCENFLTYGPRALRKLLTHMGQLLRDNFWHMDTRVPRKKWHPDCAKENGTCMEQAVCENI